MKFDELVATVAARAAAAVHTIFQAEKISSGHVHEKLIQLSDL